MNRPTLVSSTDAPLSGPVDLQRYEREARRLRRQYAQDLLAKLAIAIDLQVRRIAYRVTARLQA